MQLTNALLHYAPKPIQNRFCLWLLSWAAQLITELRLQVDNYMFACCHLQLMLSAKSEQQGLVKLLSFLADFLSFLLYIHAKKADQACNMLQIKRSSATYSLSTLYPLHTFPISFRCCRYPIEESSGRSTGGPAARARVCGEPYSAADGGEQAGLDHGGNRQRSAHD